MAAGWLEKKALGMLDKVASQSRGYYIDVVSKIICQE